MYNLLPSPGQLRVKGIITWMEYQDIRCKLKFFVSLNLNQMRTYGLHPHNINIVISLLPLTHPIEIGPLISSAVMCSQCHAISH